MDVLGVASVLKDGMMVAAYVRTDLHHFVRAVLGTNVHNDHATMPPFFITTHGLHVAKCVINVLSTDAYGNVAHTL